MEVEYKQLSHQDIMLAGDVSVPDEACHRCMLIGGLSHLEGTFSALLVATKTGCFSRRADQNLAGFCGDQTFLKPNHDVFLTLTK